MNRYVCDDERRGLLKPVAITILGSEEKRRSCCVTILYMFIGIFSCFLLLAAISATAFIIIVSLSSPDLSSPVLSSSVLPSSSSSSPSFASSSSSFAPAPSPPSVDVSPDLPTPLVKSSSPSASALILETLVRSEYPMHELANRTQE